MPYGKTIEMIGVSGYAKVRRMFGIFEPHEPKTRQQVRHANSVRDRSLRGKARIRARRSRS